MLLVFGIVVATIWVTGDNYELLPQYIGILGIGLLVNGFFAIITKVFAERLRTQQFLTAAQLIFDMVLAGIITYVQGGADARTTVLYMFPIMTAALIFGGQAVMLTAALSGATYIATLILHLYIVNESRSLETLVLPMVFYPAVFLLFGQVIRYLQRLDMMEAREKAYDSFLSLLAHQLKHPASAVTTIIDAINHNDVGEIDDTTRRYIEMLKTENENQIRLIDNLLEAAPRDRTISFEHNVDVVSLVEKIGRRLAHSNERDDDLLPMQNTRSEAIADVSSLRLSLALTNIFDNAFRYSKPGEAVHYSVTEKSGSIKILIRDSGKGMKQEEIANQLKRFVNQGIRGMERGHVGGLGIGLYSAARIARAHGGKLDIHSGHGVGTTIILTLKKEHKK